MWEGVTNYLTEEAIDATLAVITGLAQASGLLVVTYVDARALCEPSPFPRGTALGQGRGPRGRAVDLRAGPR